MDTGARRVDCVFSMMSPWAYIGHAAFVDLCARHGAAIRFRPVSLSTVFPGSGGLPLAKRHPSRQAYRLIELRRWRDRRGLRFDLQPRHWPFDPSLADRTVIALERAGADPERFIAAGFRAVWEEGRNLGDVDEVSLTLSATGHEPHGLLEAARSDAVAAAYAQDAKRALDEGVFGAPSYLLDGEVFWGQDRLDLLDDALASGRPPFGP